MTSKSLESREKTLINRSSIFLSWALMLSVSSCSYRLTNLHTSSPNNIRTVFIEAVYDTGAEIVPHEQLWDELQRAIAANGQLIITPAKKADALLRAHIFSTQFSKSGERRVSRTNRKSKEPDYFSRQSQPPAPGQIRNLSVAEDYYMKTKWQSTVRVELYDLRSQKLLLQREYPMSGEVLANRGDVAAQIHHLRHEESYNASFANAARLISEKVVTDILVQ